METNLTLTLLERWNGPTSPIAQRIVTWGYVLSALCAALVVFQTNLQEQGLVVPQLMVKISEVAGYVPSLLATVSKFNVDPQKLPDYLKEVAKQRALEDL